MNANMMSELNSVAESVGLKNRVFFHEGDTVSVVNSVAPYGKVAVLYAKNTFLEEGKEFTAKLKAAGITPLNFIVPEGVSLTPKNVFDVIGVPEDVRAIVYSDQKVTDIAAYLATIFNIPVICTLKTVYTENLIGVKLPFFWGDKTDFFDAHCTYHIVLGENLTSGDISKQYINVISKITALTDYRVNLKICGGRAEKAAYGLIKSAVESALTLNKNPETALVIAGLKIELANLASGGKIICNSAEYAFKRLLRFNVDSSTALAFLEKQLRLYALCAENSEMPFITPDYNARATELAEITGSRDGAFLQGFVNQVAYLKKADIVRIKAGLQTELKSQQNALDMIERQFAAFGGKKSEDFSPYIAAFRLCGDMPDTCNFMTLVREGGFTEFIR